MRNLFKKHAMALAALAIAATSATLMSFGKNQSGEFHYYNNSATSGFNTISRWQTMNNNESCVEEGDRPCRVFVPDGQTLTDVIGGQSDSNILNNLSEGRKD